MAKIETRILGLGTEELHEIMKKYAPLMAAAGDHSWSANDVDHLLEYLFSAAALNQHSQAASAFSKIKPAVHQLIESGVDKERATDQLMEWSMAAIRFIPEQFDEFVCMDIYLDLFHVLEEGGEAQLPKMARAKIQLAHHFQYWLEKGGQADDLPEEHRLVLEDAQSTFAETAEKAIALCDEKGDADEAVSIHRNLTRYYLARKKPNDAIAHKKAVVEKLPATKDYSPWMKGEELLEIGQLFLNYKKKDVARKYFEQAREVFVSMGEDAEMGVIQADSWIEQCDKMK